MSQMTKTERAELKQVVKSQFRVLREEIEQRELEVIADMENQVNEKYRDEDEAYGRATVVAQELLVEMNQKVNDTFREIFGDAFVEGQYVSIILPNRQQSTIKRSHLVRAGRAQVAAQAKGAVVRLKREEADLLKELAVGALESDAAKEFLASIPAVGELVPRARLAELEASLDDDASDPFFGHQQIRRLD